MNRISMALLVSASLVGGCGGGHSNRQHHDSPPPAPVLLAFDLVDSYGVDSAAVNAPPPRLNPYTDNGQFEIYWDVERHSDYTLQLRISELPYLEGSRLVSEVYCGRGLDCDEQGVLFCDYYADFSIACGLPASDPLDWPITRFDDMVHSIPEKLHLLLDICDTVSSACEYWTREVWFE